MKILIVDNSSRERGFSTELTSNANVKIKNSGFGDMNFENCRMIFKHDSFNHELNSKIKSKIIFIEFSGGNMKNEILNNADGYKFKATIEFSEQVNNVLNIIGKSEFSKDDLEMILNFDPTLEKFLNPFEATNPYETTNTQGKFLKDAKAELQTYVGEYLKKQSKS